MRRDETRIIGSCSSCGMLSWFEVWTGRLWRATICASCGVRYLARIAPHGALHAAAASYPPARPKPPAREERPPDVQRKAAG